MKNLWRHARRMTLGLFVSTALAGCGGDDDGPVPADGAATDGAPSDARDTGDAGDASSTRDSSSASDASEVADAADAAASIAVSDFCATSAAKRCASLDKCLPWYGEWAYTEPSACVGRETALCRASHPIDGRLRADDVASFVGCLDGLSCDAPWEDDCPPPRLTGAKPVGGSCADAFDCETRACSRGKSGCGRCVEPQPTGGACAVDGDCATGGLCLRGKCVATGGLGEACDDALRFCRNGLRCSSLRCVKAGAEGASCADQLDCDVLAALDCNKVSGKCEKITWLSAGESCNGFSIDGPPLWCAHGTWCNAPKSTETGTCVARVVDGTACAGATEASCQHGAGCVGGVCDIPKALACP